MKKIIVYTLLVVVSACNNNNNNANDTIKDKANTDTAQAVSTDNIVADTVRQKDGKIENIVADTFKPKNGQVNLVADIVKPIKVNKDSILLILRKDILVAIKNKDYKQFAGFFHPLEGVRFSPYGYINVKTDVNFKPEVFVEKAKDKRSRINWGAYDGSGDPILLTVDGYFKRFVYNAEFLRAEKVSVNKIIGTGNSLNNIKEIYKGADFVESYFSGFDKKLDGMDWTSLRLVFKKHNDKYYLVGVIHDQWTS